MLVFCTRNWLSKIPQRSQPTPSEGGILYAWGRNRNIEVIIQEELIAESLFYRPVMCINPIVVSPPSRTPIHWNEQKAFRIQLRNPNIRITAMSVGVCCNLGDVPSGAS